MSPGMAKVSKRLEYLLKLTGPQGAGAADPFAWYGLAMEYRSLERHDDAMATFEALRARAPEYVPMYLMCGQMLEKIGRADDARAWLAAGADAARKQGNGHALSELEGALAALG
jgi:tetratricopeptide (TPR) repeat protein